MPPFWFRVAPSYSPTDEAYSETHFTKFKIPEFERENNSNKTLLSIVFSVLSVWRECGSVCVVHASVRMCVCVCVLLLSLCLGTRTLLSSHLVLLWSGKGVFWQA